MGTLRAIALTKPGSVGMNTVSDISDEKELRFAATALNAVVDKAGKLVSREDFVLQTSGSTVVADVIYNHRNNDGTETMMSAGSGVVSSGISSLTTRFDHQAGSQIIDVGGAKVAATATGLANDATVYGFTVAVDGGAAGQISVTGSAAQTYTTLLSEINTDLVGATCVLSGGNLKIISDTTGAASSISILTAKGTASNALITTLTSFVAVRTASAGTVTNDNWQFASLNSRIFMAQAGQHFTVLNETSFAVESVTDQPWVGMPNVVMAADGRIWAADDQNAPTAGYQVVGVGANKTLSSATNLVAATTYTASCVVDGAISLNISIVGSSAATFATLIEQLNLDLSGAQASLVDGDLRITSNSGGPNSTVSITVGTLFAAPLAGFTALATAVVGTTTGAANRYTIWWSDLLNGNSWGGGDAGQIDLRNAWPSGQDFIVGLGFISGRLIVFGRASILMYTLPADHDPASMTLTDVIENIGCTARDSIVETDQGIYFLSDNGVYRIDRLGQITSLAVLPEMSKLVAGDLITTYASETLTAVRGGYFPKEGWYVLNAPVANVTYAFHTRRMIGEASTGEVPVVTKWNNVGVPFLAFAFDKSGNWYCGMRNGVAKYTGYTPDGASNAYNFDFYTLWQTFGDETRLKHLKSVVLVLEADSGQTGTLRWQTDYLAGTVNTAAFTCDATEFAEAPGIGEVKVQIGRSCGAVKVGFTMPIAAGDKVTLHAMRIYSQGGGTKM